MTNSQAWAMRDWIEILCMLGVAEFMWDTIDAECEECQNRCRCNGCVRWMYTVELK